MPESTPPSLLSQESSYEVISMPSFESNIPPMLLEKVPQEIQWIMQNLSKLTQAVDWLCHNLVEENKHLREVDTRRIETRLVVSALSEEQKHMRDRVDKLEKAINERNESDRIAQNANASRQDKNSSAIKALSVLLSKQWFLILLGILVIFGGFIGASVGMQGFLKLITGLL
jgi:Fe2+ transport system protein B